MKPRAWIVRLCLLGCTAAPGLALAADPIDEAEGVRRVCAAGPRGSVARAHRLRGAAAVAAADVLPNPSVVLEHQRSLSGPSEHETVAGVSVPLGIGGRRFLLQDAALARREQAVLEAHATLFEAALAFREAYVAAVVDRERLKVLGEHQTALEALSTTIRGLAKGGEAARYDLLRQQNQARLHHRLLESTKARAQASAALLEAWTGVEVAPTTASLAELAGGSRVAGRSAPEPSGAHPEVRGLEAAGRASSLEARAARRAWVPDLDVFAGYRTTTVGSSTGHGISLSVSIPFTLFDHGQGEAARADAEHEIARATAKSRRRELGARLKAARLQLATLQASVPMVEEAATDAATLETMAKQLYAAGEANITELLDAFRGGEEARLARIDLAEQIALARLAVMRATGTLFEPGLDRACGAAHAGSAP